MTEYLQVVENTLEKLFAKTFLIITISIILGLIIRIYFTPWNLPLNSPDAIIIMIEGLAYTKGDFTYFTPRFLWPAFNSIFFMFFNFDNNFGYASIMRIVTISVSVATIPIVYLVSKKIVKKKYALLATILFTIEPNLVENSIFSISESMFIFLGLIAFYFAMQKNDKYLLFAFLFAGLSFDTRLNGIVLFIVVVYSCLTRIKTKRTWVIILIGLCIFVAISSNHIIHPLLNETPLFPIIANTVDTISNERSNVSTYEVDSLNILSNALKNELLHILRISIPYLFVLFPIGVIISLTNLNNQTKLVFVAIITTLAIAIPQYTMSNEYRNLFFLTPFLCIFSVIGIQKLVEKVDMKNIFLILLVAGLILLSANFLKDRYDIDENYFLEKDDFGKYVVNNFEGNIAGNMRLEIIRNIPDMQLDSKFYNEKMAFFDPGTRIDSIPQLMKFSKENNIDYFIIEEYVLQKYYPVFDEILMDKNQYVYLEEVFDSGSLDYKKLKAKIFKINWSEYNDI
jgi:hypothetical protein